MPAAKSTNTLIKLIKTDPWDSLFCDTKNTSDKKDTKDIKYTKHQNDTKNTKSSDPRVFKDVQHLDDTKGFKDQK